MNATAAATTPSTEAVHRDDAGAITAADSPRTVAAAVPVFLRHGSPRILLVAVTVSLAVRAWLADWSWWDLVPVAALSAYWPIQEWLIHVYILHFKPITVGRRTLDFRVPRKHREHHREPWKIDILFIPMHTWLYSIPIVCLIWWVLAPTAALAMTGITVHFALALHYEWVHYLTHTRYWPRTALYQRLWRNHRWHHFKNEHYWYGVTMLSGDRLLGTAPAVKDVPTSPTARSLLAAG